MIENLDADKIVALANRLAELNLGEVERNKKPLAELKAVVEKESDNITSLLTQLATAEKLGVGGDLEKLISEAKRRRDEAQGGIDRLEVQDGLYLGGELEPNLEMLGNAKQLLCGVLAIGKPSGALYLDEGIEMARKLLESLGLQVTLYGEDNLIGISLDLGVLSWVKNGTRKGIRTPVAAVKGRSPRPLDDTRLMAYKLCGFERLFSSAR